MRAFSLAWLALGILLSSCGSTEERASEPGPRSSDAAVGATLKPDAGPSPVHADIAVAPEPDVEAVEDVAVEALDVPRELDPIADLDPALLEELDVDPTSAELATTVEELIDAIAPGKTIVLAPGTYTVPPGGLGPLETTSDVTLIGGAGPALPRLVDRDGDRSVVALRGTSGVTLARLSVSHASGIEPVASPLRIVDSNRVRLQGVTILGSGPRCVDVVGSRDVTIAGSRVHACRSEVAHVLNSVGVQLIDTGIHGGEGLRAGLGISDSEVRITDSWFDGNKSPWGAQAVMFDVDPEHELAPGVTTGVPAPRQGSRVIIERSRFRHNRFAKLTNASEHVTVDAKTTLPEGQFEDRSHSGESGWWCHCRWSAADGGFEPETSCQPAPKACADAAQSVAKGEASGVLPASVFRQCKPTYGHHPADELGDRMAWTRGRKPNAWSRAGSCALGSKATTLSAARGEQAAVRWSDMAPLRNAGTTGSRVWAMFPMKDEKAIKAYADPHAAPKKFRHKDKRIPAEVLAFPTPHIVTEKGVMRPAEFKTAEVIATLYDGEWWKVNYPKGPARGVAVALAGPPHADATLRRAPKPRARGGEHAAVRAARAALSPEDRRFLAGLTDVEFGVQQMTGSFPAGVTTIAVVTLHGANDEVEPSLVFTMDDKGNVVQSLSGDAGLRNGWAHLEFLGDLDGDGFDEIAWNTGGIEDEQRMLTRLTDTSIEHTTLFASGH